MSIYITDVKEMTKILDDLEKEIGKRIPNKDQATKALGFLLQKYFSETPIENQLTFYVSINTMLLSVIDHKSEGTMQ
jgi:hypothetical protein